MQDRGGPMLTIVSGGQTGVDRAALDLALRLGVGCGGWIARGRRAEDGVLPAHYPLRETPQRAYPQRTRRNVRDSDATLIVTRGEPSGGTAFTLSCAQHLGRPCWLADLDRQPDPGTLCDWLRARRVRVLNVAGPRESIAPGIYRDATRFLEVVLETFLDDPTR